MFNASRPGASWPMAAVTVLLAVLSASCDDGPSNRGSLVELRVGPAVSIGSDAARACDLLVVLADEATPRFASGVRGTFKRRGKRLALAFVSREDKPLGDAFELWLGTPDATIKAEDVTADCYDALGKPVEPAISIKAAP